jgi:hypothetical protein
MHRYYQGRFKPKNPKKYMGDPTNIIYRSRWELRLMRYIDEHPKVIKWGSEELVIPYLSPIDGKYHRYFTDFVVKQINKEGKKETIVIEVKPKSQTIAPDSRNAKTKTGRNSPKYIREVATYGINQAKWKAAEEFCKDRGWKFQILTEHELGIK